MMKIDVTRSMSGLAAALLSVFSLCLLAGGAAADDDASAYDPTYEDLSTLSSSVELGTIFNSSNEFKFGDYTGLTDDGWFVLGNVDIRRRNVYDADRPFYYRVRGLNLGLDSRYVDAEYKRQGLFGLSFVFNEMPKYQTDSAKTFFKNTGSQFLELPAGWVGKESTAADMASLDPDLRNLQIDHKRRRLGGGLSLVLPKGFDFDAKYTRETKRGEKLFGAVIGTSGGNPRAVVVPESIDFVTHQVDTKVGYTTDDLQLQFQYYASGFKNQSDHLRWENPFNDVRGWSSLAGWPTGEGQKAGMPDNWFHQIVGSGGVSLPANSRLMVNGAFGWGIQEANYLPYTVNDGLVVTRGLPRSDLDGMLKTRMVNIRFVSKPLRKSGVSISYRWNNRDNDSPVDTYFRVRSDSADQSDSHARINRPYSFQRHQFDADFSYEVYKRTKLTVMYGWDRMNRNLQEVKENDEHTFGAKLVSRTNRYVTGGIRYERSYRNGSRYDCVKPLVVTEAGDFECSQDGDFENEPWLRKSYMANRHRNDLHVWANLMPIASLTIAPSVRYIDDDYYASTFGLTSYRSFTQGVDMTWTPCENLNFHTFYSYGKNRSKMSAVQGSLDISRYWTHEDKDIFHTFGAGMDVDVIPGRLGFGMDYLFTRSRGNNVTSRGPGLAPDQPFPDEVTKLHNISVHGDLQITPNLSTRLGYLFEKYRSNDWATEAVCPGCLSFSSRAAVIASGENSPDYGAHVVSLSMKWEFR